MAQIEIPETWRTQVYAILKTEATGTLIEWTTDARNRYEADSDFAWDHEVYDSLGGFLSGPKPHGCLVSMAKPVGETYEFYFPFKGATFYGKLMLRDDQKRVVLFSAHSPLKNKLSCE